MKTIYQLDHVAALDVTDKCEVSQSDSPASTSKYFIIQELLDLFESELDLTSDQVSEGSDNLYLSIDGGSTDNLEAMPTIIDIQSQLDFIEKGTTFLNTDSNYVLTSPMARLTVAALPMAGHYIQLPNPSTDPGIEDGNEYTITGEISAEPVDVRSHLGNTIVSLQPGQTYILIYTTNSDLELSAIDGWIPQPIITNSIVESWNGSTDPVNVTAGTGINIDDGVISFSGDVSITLQDAYDEGSINEKGFILLEPDNANPLIAAIDYAAGPQTNIVAMNLVNPAMASQPRWGFDLVAFNDNDEKITYARLEGVVAINTQDEESGSLVIKLKSQGADYYPIFFDGLNKETTLIGNFSRVVDSGTYEACKDLIINQNDSVASRGFFLSPQSTDNKGWIDGVEGQTYKKSIIDDGFSSSKDYFRVLRNGMNIDGIYFLTGNEVGAMSIDASGNVNLPLLTANRYLVCDNGNKISTIDGPDSGSFVQIVTAVSGASSPAFVKCFYSVVSNASGNSVIVTSQFTFTATNTTPVIRLENPISKMFGSTGQANGSGTVYVTSNPNLDTHTVYDIDTSSGQNAVDVKMVVNTGSGNYTCNVVYMFLL